MKWFLSMWPWWVGAGFCVLLARWSMNRLLHLVTHFDDSPTDSRVRRRAPQVWVTNHVSLGKEWNSESDVRTAGVRARH